VTGGRRPARPVSCAGKRPPSLTPRRSASPPKRSQRQPDRVGLLRREPRTGPPAQPNRRNDQIQGGATVRDDTPAHPLDEITTQAGPKFATAKAKPGPVQVITAQYHFGAGPSQDR
jgi:hypothetical protein